MIHRSVKQPSYQVKTNSGRTRTQKSKSKGRKASNFSPKRQESETNTVEGAQSQTPPSDLQLSQLKQVTGLKKSALSKISIGSRKRQPEGSTNDLQPVMQSLSSGQVFGGYMHD